MVDFSCIVEPLSKKTMKSILPLTLPEDLIAEILLRLPVKSLLRFKCVCKSWLYHISDPQFAKSQFDLAIIPTHRVLVRSVDNSKVNSIEVETPFRKHSSEVVLNIPPPLIYGCSVGIMGSCRGFILLTNYVHFDQVIDFVIWNPSTDLCKQVRNVARSIHHAHLYGIGYDSSNDDYAIVTIKLPRTQRNRQLGTEVQSFSLRTNSWCYTKGTVSHYHLGSGFSDGLFLNGVLHWLVKSYDNLRIIIAFDVTEKRLSEIPMPLDVAIGLESKTYHLRAMGKYLCLYLMGKRSEIWMMKEYKVQSSWTKLFVLSTNFFYRPRLFFRICFSRNEQGELLELHTHGSEMGEFGVIDSVMYRESLLSLPEPKHSTKHRPKRVIKRPAGWDDFIHYS